MLFDLLGDMEAATYFSRMAVAAYAERESGHTGNFFNHLWSFPGVSRAGPAATAAYFAEAGWELELGRAHHGAMPYQSTPAEKSDDSYENWDCTGAYALAYALPLKKTIVTGRRPSVVEPLTGEVLRETIDAGRDFTYWTEKTCYDGRSSEALFAGLSSWSPAVRKRSAVALGKKEGDFTGRLQRMLASDDRLARYGAAEALARRGEKSDAAGDALRKRLTDPDPWLRTLAAQAIAELGKEEREKSVPALLVAAAVQDSADPRRRFASAAGEALFSTSPGKNEPQPILKKSLQGVDRPALYAAIRALLANEDGRIRSYVAPVLRLLDDADLAEVLPDLAAAISQRPPSGQMFAYEIRMVGLDVLAKHGIAEGLDLALKLLNEDEWGREFDRPARALLVYGGAAKPLLPRLETETQAIADKRNDDKLKKALAKLIEDVKAAPAEKPLTTIAEFRAKHGRK